MNIEITIPETWQDIKLGQFMEYMKALKPYEGTPEYEVVKYEKAMNYFCNITTDIIRKLPMENYNGIMAEMVNLFQQGEQMPLVKHFTIDGIEYGFMPSLDEMTYGEYLDLTTYSENMWDNVSTIIAILYRPITKKNKVGYIIKPYNGTDEKAIEVFYNSLTMDIVWGAIGFFTILQKDLLKGMIAYLTKTLENLKITSQVQETLIRSGVDTSVLQSSQEMILQSLKLLQDSISTNA